MNRRVDSNCHFLEHSLIPCCGWLYSNLSVCLSVWRVGWVEWSGSWLVARPSTSWFMGIKTRWVDEYLQSVQGAPIGGELQKRHINTNHQTGGWGWWGDNSWRNAKFHHFWGKHETRQKNNPLESSHVIRENELQMFCRVGGAVVYGDKKNLSQSVSLIPSFSDIVQQRQSIRKS